MTDRPILFSGPMVRALLDGRKTQTRRVHFTQDPQFRRTCDEGCDSRLAGMCLLPKATCGRRRVTDARFAIGDRLWVRETWSHTGDGVFEIRQARIAPTGRVIFAATPADDAPHAKYWPSIHMPREFSRLTIAVTDVRVERLQDISEADAIAEGVKRVRDAGDPRRMSTPEFRVEGACAGVTARDTYAALWDSLNAKRGFGWGANPWVVALTFTVHHQNIDAPGAKEAA